MRLQELLNEGLSPVLYHSTHFNNIKKILNSNSFRLTPDLGTDSEASSRKKDKIYYLSTARSKAGEYHFPASDYSLSGMFVLDGKKLQSRGYSGSPLDYWAGFPSDAKKNEMEDRIFSRKPTIPNANEYIKELHIMLGYKNTKDVHQSDARKIHFLARQLGIPVYFYTDPKAFDLLNKHKSVPATKFDARAKIEPRYSDVKRKDPKTRRERNYFAPYIELLSVDNSEQLSKEASKMLYNLRFSDAVRLLKADIHNSRTMAGKREQLDKFLSKIKSLGLNSAQEVIDHINNKFDDNRR